MTVTLDFEEESFQIVLKALANERDRDRAYRHSGAAEVLSRAAEQIEQQLQSAQPTIRKPIQPEILTKPKKRSA